MVTQLGSYHLLTNSCSKAVDLSSNLVTGIELRAGTTVTRLRQRMQPYATTASEGLMVAAETADKYVVDPLVEEYSQGGPQAVIMRTLHMCKDVIFGFISGLCSRDSDADSRSKDEAGTSMKSGAEESDRHHPPIRSFLLSKVDTLFYFPLVVTLKSCADSVFAQPDPREGNAHSYVYCLGWEVGSWTVESVKHLMEVIQRYSPIAGALSLMRRVTAPEVNFSGLGECLARRIPSNIHPILEQMGKLRAMYSCERRLQTRHSYYVPNGGSDSTHASSDEGGEQ